MDVGNLEKSSFLSPVKNISILLLLMGIGSLFLVLPVWFFSPFRGLLQLVIAVGLIVISFGLRKMKKWALYAYTVIAVLSIISALYSYLSAGRMDTIELVSIIVEIAILVYFWAISKKFN